MIARPVLALGLSLFAAGRAAPPPKDAADEVVLVGTLEGIPLADLIAIASDVTGEPFFFEPRDVDVDVIFLGTVGVPWDRFLEFFELCLRIEGYVVVDETVGGRELHKVVRLGQQARGQQSLKTAARFVSPEELELMSGRGCLVTTYGSFEHVPAEGVDHMLCLYCSDSTYQSVRLVPGTKTLVMTGVAREVAALLAMARRLDEEIGL